MEPSIIGTVTIVVVVLQWLLPERDLSKREPLQTVVPADRVTQPVPQGSLQLHDQPAALFLGEQP